MRVMFTAREAWQSHNRQKGAPGAWHTRPPGARYTSIT
jgi:hypothetical protein